MASVFAHGDITGNVASASASFRAMLRDATRPQHEVLDEALSRFDLGAAPSYRRFLLAHRHALAVLIERCNDDDRREFAPLLTLLHDDLGLPIPSRAPDLGSPPSDPATEAGVAYVVRGSRLGAAFLRRRVGAELPARYLHHELSTSWTTFLSRLESTAPRTAQARSAVIDAARMAFGVFAETAGARTPVD